MARPSFLTPDSVAASLSGLCLVHCLALPFLLLWIGADQALFGGSGWVHLLLLGTALPVSGFTLVRGMRHHHMLRPALVAGAGFAFMVAGVLQQVESTETLLTVTGALLVGIAHFGNWRAARLAGGDCCPSDAAHGEAEEAQLSLETAPRT